VKRLKTIMDSQTVAEFRCRSDDLLRFGERSSISGKSRVKTKAKVRTMRLVSRYFTQRKHVIRTRQSAAFEMRECKVKQLRLPGRRRQVLLDSLLIEVDWRIN
jgi:hypothetical protein